MGHRYIELFGPLQMLKKAIPGYQSYSSRNSSKQISTVSTNPNFISSREQSSEIFKYQQYKSNNINNNSYQQRINQQYILSQSTIKERNNSMQNNNIKKFGGINDN